VLISTLGHTHDHTLFAIIFAKELSMPAIDPWDDHVSPDGSIRIEIEASEKRASVWTLSPRVIDTRTGAVLLNFWRTNWDAVVSWPKADTAMLVLRRFNFPGTYTVLIDPNAGTYTLVEGGMQPQPLAGLQQGIEAAFEREQQLAGQRPYSSDSDNGSFHVSIIDLIKTLMGGPALVVGGICMIVAGFVLDEPLMGYRPGRLGLLNGIERYFGVPGAIGVQIFVGCCIAVVGAFVTEHGRYLLSYFRRENREKMDKKTVRFTTT
jgi:hypothetical protein